MIMLWCVCFVFYKIILTCTSSLIKSLWAVFLADILNPAWYIADFTPNTIEHKDDYCNIAISHTLLISNMTNILYIFL